MHDPSARGNDFFKCDFCLSAWSEDRQMVEGHRGALICVKCLTLAYAQVVTQDAGQAAPAGVACTLCLEQRTQKHWRSPLRDEAWACERCIRQSGQVLEKDPDSGWTRPGRG
ncbi:MAG: hypothetical protein KDA05_01665 [Phycisphaerales bacterium]|nr:hypothetical protein [Phycisphaerales bacterium]MCB9840781.1 hypothetical protein [Phycisphaeraceae bacterium]